MLAEVTSGRRLGLFRPLQTHRDRHHVKLLTRHGPQNGMPPLSHGLPSPVLARFTPSIPTDKSLNRLIMSCNPKLSHTPQLRISPRSLASRTPCNSSTGIGFSATVPLPSAPTPLTVLTLRRRFPFTNLPADLLAGIKGNVGVARFLVKGGGAGLGTEQMDKLGPRRFILWCFGSIRQRFGTRSHHHRYQHQLHPTPLAPPSMHQPTCIQITLAGPVLG